MLLDLYNGRETNMFLFIYTNSLVEQFSSLKDLIITTSCKFLLNIKWQPLKINLKKNQTLNCVRGQIIKSKG